MKPRTCPVSAHLVAVLMLSVPAAAFEIGRARTEAKVDRAASGRALVQLTFLAELVNGDRPAVWNTVAVRWQEVAGVEPQPFNIQIPGACFRDRRGMGFYVDDFRSCGVKLWVDSGARGLVLLDIVDFRARIVAGTDGTTRFDIVTSFVPPDPVIPPDPIIPPDPVKAFLGQIGGAAVTISIGSDSAAAGPLSTNTVSGVDPEPF